MASSPIHLPTGARKVSSLCRVMTVMGIGRLAWIACGLTIVVMGVVALLVRHAELAQIRSSLDASVSLNAKGYAKFVALNVAIMDRQLIAQREQYLLGERLPAQAIVNDTFKELDGLLLQVSVANAEGLVVGSSLGLPSAPTSLADRPYFRMFKNKAEDELYISEPMVGKVSGKLSLQLVRPILAPDGQFLGVIVVSIDPEWLKTYFTGMNALKNQGKLVILGTDGIVRFRLTDQGFSVDQNVRTIPLWHDISTLPSGIYDETGTTDNIDRRVAFHKVDGYPLILKVGTGLGMHLRNFDVRWILIWCMAAALAAGLAVVAGTIAKLAREEKRSYALLEQSRAQALKSNQIKSNFLASVSHELRTPLNSILGFSELIRDTVQEPKTRQYAGLIHTSGTHLHALVNTILDLAKIESGQMRLTLEPIDLPMLLQTLTAIHKVNADTKNVALSLLIDGVLQGTVNSDRTKIVQVINNVIHNAIKFTPSGAISVVLKPEGHAGLVISVIDSGIGIPASKTGQVFKRFNTIDTPAGSFGAKGTGLGLALCQELLHLMQGRISLISEVGNGTTVDIFIPYTITVENIHDDSASPRSLGG